MDSRRIHEPLDEVESRETSEMGGGAHSPCRMNECRRLEPFGGVIWEVAERGRRVVITVVEARSWEGRWEDVDAEGSVSSAAGTWAADEVPGRDDEGGRA